MMKTLKDCLDHEEFAAAAIVRAFVKADIYGPKNDSGNILSARSFRQAGMSTDAEGLVIELHDGSEYQITARRTR